MISIHLLQTQENSNQDHKNRLSDKSKQKVKRAVKYLLYYTTEKTAYNYKTQSRFKFKLNFLTLTLSSKQIHTDNEIKSGLLNQFFVECRKKWGITNYIWKAEKQVNGNVHFHIICDKFIPWNELRQTWNRIQNKYGYIDQFYLKYHHRNPNSTDIHSLKKVNNPAAYILKYISKDLKDQDLKGRIWSCSYNLTKLSGATVEMDETIMKEINRLEQFADSKRINKDYFSGIFFNNKRLSHESFPVLFDLMSEYIKKIFPNPQYTIWNDYSPPSGHE
jgi:hypothetical protein